jgi:antitoxin ChpS
MHTTNLRKVGGSVMLAVPPAILDILGLGPGATVTLTVVNGRLVIEAERRPRYTLEELVALCDASAPLPAGDREWLDAKPVGGELL